MATADSTDDDTAAGDSSGPPACLTGAPGEVLFRFDSAGKVKRCLHLQRMLHDPPLIRWATWFLISDLPPGYETTPDIFDRAQRFIRRLRREYAGGEVAAVSHGHVLLWMHLWVRGLPFTLETQFDIDPFPETASITTLTFDDGADLPALTYHSPY